MLEEVLSRIPARITSVASAIAAERVAQIDPPDLIISDLQLEDSDGLAMIERLKIVLPNVPVLLLTGVLFDEEVIRDTVEKKVSAYLPKTAPLSKIQAEVRRLLKQTKSG